MADENLKTWASKEENKDARNRLVKLNTELKQHMNKVTQLSKDGIILESGKYIDKYNKIVKTTRILNSTNIFGSTTESGKIEANVKMTLKTGNLNTKICISNTVPEKIFGIFEDILKSSTNNKAILYFEILKYPKDTSSVFKEVFNLPLTITNIEKNSSSEYYLHITFPDVDNDCLGLRSGTSNICKVPVSASLIYTQYEEELKQCDALRQQIATIMYEKDKGVGDRQDYYSLKTDEDVEKFNTDLNNNTPVQKPTDKDKQNTLSQQSDPARKAPEKITVTGGKRASIMQGKLSQENLEQGSNQKDDNHFDKRPGNAKLGDIYGMQTKLNAPGCIKLYKANGENGYQEPVSIDCFLLQSVQTSLKEKFSIFQSLSGDVLAYFFGKQPVIYRFSAALYNTYNQEWAHDFRNYYEKYLRGSSSIGKNLRTVVSYENHVIEGFFLEMNMQESATNTNLVNIDFSILFIQDHVIGYDEPSFSSLDEEESYGGMYGILTKGSSSSLSAPNNFTVEKPSGSEDVTLSSDTLLRSSPGELNDNKLKVVRAGETITIDNTPVYGNNGDEWYAVTGGKYKDGERIGTNNAVYIKKDAVKGASSEDSLANRKAFDAKNPEAAEVKFKSELNQQSKETEQIKKKVEAAKEKSINFNSRLNASIKKDGTPVYSAPSNQSPVIATLNKGNRCETLHNEGIYTKIVFNESTGFVESRKLKIGG